MGNIEKTPLKPPQFNKGKRDEYVKGEKKENGEEYDFYNIERKEEGSYYSMLRKELKMLREAGADVHFSQIEPYNLSEKALDLYREYKKIKLTEEKIKDFREKTSVGDNEYNFAALLLKWVMDGEEKIILEEKKKEKSNLKNSAGKKIEEFKKTNPSMIKYLEEISLDALKKYDLEAIIDPGGNIESYEVRLREYFKNKRPTNKETGELENLDPSVVENDARYKNYYMLCRLLDREPFFPQGYNKIK